MYMDSGQGCQESHSSIVISIRVSHPNNASCGIQQKAIEVNCMRLRIFVIIIILSGHVQREGDINTKFNSILLSPLSREDRG
jgi:hypothetical protein